MDMFGHQVGQSQISSELDNFGTFSHQISVDFGTVRQNILKLILKCPRFVPFGAISGPIKMQNLTFLLPAIWIEGSIILETAN